MSRHVLAKLLLFALFTNWVSPSYAHHHTHIHWVGLFPADFFEQYIVGKDRKNIGRWTVPIYENPNQNAPMIGALEINFAAETGLRVDFELLASKKKYSIVPHLYDSDYFYGPYFHLTVLNSKHGFLNIKLADDLEPYWGNFVSAFGERNVSTINLQQGDILHWINNAGDEESIYIEHTNPDGLVVRDEQAADMWCGDESLFYKPYQTKLIPQSDWIGNNGKSRFDITYTRGC